MLQRAIRSIIDQTFRDFEVIIVDDASTDSTPDVVKSFQDDRLIYIRREKNGCAAAARNSGIMQAKGEYISFLDDDDEYLREFLEKTWQALNSASKSIGFVWCGVRKVKDTASGEVIIKEMSWKDETCIQTEAPGERGHHLGASTSYGLTVRKSCFQSIGLFDETIKGIEDIDLLIRLGRCFGYVIISQILVKIHLHDGPQLTNRTPQRAEAYERFLNKNLSFFKRDSKRWIRVNRNSAALFYQSGNKSKGRKIMTGVLLRHPGNLRLWKSFLCFEFFGTEQLGLRQIFSFSR